MTFDERLRRARDDYRGLDVASQSDGLVPPPPGRVPPRARATVVLAAVAACVLVAVAAVVLRAGDGTTGVDTVAPGSTPGTVVEGSAVTFPTCTELRTPEAPADRYRATPAYVGNDYPRDEVRAWAETQPGYVTIWADRNHNGWLTVGFTGDVDQHQADLEAQFPGVGVVAVQAAWTIDELEELRSRVAVAMRPFPVGLATLEQMGVVQVDVGIKTPERMAALEPFAGERLCVNGLDASAAVVPGPQPEGGDGWRLLGEGLTGKSFRTGVATDDAQYAALWAQAGLTGAPPDVDFEDEIVIWFGAVQGGDYCPIRLDDVLVDRDAALVFPLTVQPDNRVICPSVAAPHSFAVAVERSKLPEGPFHVQLGADDPPPGAPEERTVVAVDLSMPGSTATDAQLTTDPELVEDTDLRNEVGSGGDISVGDAWPYRLVATCDAHILGVINGTLWEATDVAPGVIPDAWRTLVDEDGVILVDIVLSYEGPALVATANGATVTYGPSTADRSRYVGDGECVGPYR